MGITLIQLEYFRALAENGSVTKTAEELHITQAALTRMIRRLEEELETDLFDRRGKKLMLNTAGTAFLQTAYTISDELDKGIHTLERIKGNTRNSVSFCLVGAATWRNFISSFHENYPDISIKHSELFEKQFTEQLLNAQLDFVIEGGLPLENEKIASTYIAEESVYAVFHPGHLLAGRNAVSFSELQAEPLITFNKEHTFRKLVDYFFSKTGYVPNIIVECHNSVIKDIFSITNGYMLVPSLDSIELSVPGAVYVPVNDSFAHYPLQIYWRKGHIFTPAMQVFHDYLIDWVYKKLPTREAHVEKLKA